MNLRTFLVRGLLAGVLAGLFAFAFAYAVGETSVDAAIAIEDSHGAQTHDHSTAADSSEAHDHGTAAGEAAPEPELVSRFQQKTFGLPTGTVVAGATLGGLVGILSAVALGRFGSVGPRATTLLVTGIGFVALYVLPFAFYPPNPPAVGRAETIGLRSALYFTLVAISVLSAILAVAVGRRLAPTWGPWYAALAVVAGYLLLVVSAGAALPTYDEVPADFPASLLYRFRAASFLTQLILWTVLGLTLAELVHRVVRPAHPRSAGRPTVSVAA